MGKARRFSARELERLLSRYGFQLVSQSGSHRKWHRTSDGRTVIVPYHAGETLPTGTVRSILTGAAIPESEWRTD